MARHATPVTTTVSSDGEETTGEHPSFEVIAPSWLTPGARVRKVGSWPRVGLLDGTEGTVVSLDVFDGHLRWFKVKWDNHTSRGVDHYGWHALQGNVTPSSSNETSSTGVEAEQAAAAPRVGPGDVAC